MENKIFTEEEFNKTDYCYELSDEKLSDDIEEYIEDIYVNDTTPQYEIEQIIENAKEIIVYEKDYIQITSGHIEGYLQDYFEDNYYCSYFDFDVIEQTGIKSLIEEISKKVNESKCWYTSGEKVGYLDLSKQVKEYIESEIKQ